MVLERISRVAVIGSGVMGAGIAASIANAGLNVWLYDIVPEDATERSILAKDAIERMRTSHMLTHPDNVKRITPANLEDDMLLMMDFDWIIEVIIEKIELKQELYKKIEKFRNPNSIISSNTSTIPLEDLIDGRLKQFKEHFLITHFFNPPRYMPLLELVMGEDTLPEVGDFMHQFLDNDLGKTVVLCKDTPGFIANRIGCFWLEVGLGTAIHMHMRVEDVDMVIGKLFGFPKTGILGLYDLIGVDLMPLICKSLLENVPWEDPFHEHFKDYPLIQWMIDNGYTGRKGKGGFYKMTKKDGKKEMEVLDLVTKTYRPFEAHPIEVMHGVTPKAFLESDEDSAAYAWIVLSRTIHYAALLIPEISDTIYNVDEAMKLGYNWKYGPFELVDLFSDDTVSGAAWIKQRFEKEQVDIPDILLHVANANANFYKVEDGVRFMATLEGGYQPIPTDPSHRSLLELTLDTPILENDDAVLWDIGDNVACFAIKTKLNILTEKVFQLLKDSIQTAESSFQAMIIATDKPHFSAGANLQDMLDWAEAGNLEQIENYLKLGQSAMTAMKFAKIPIISAAAGVAYGGGCELLLHSAAIVAHSELQAGLVESRVGLIPGWGGCKEMLLAAQQDNYDSKELERIFLQLLTGFASESAQEAKEKLFKHHQMDIVMNRKRLISAAKEKAIRMAQHYRPPLDVPIKTPHHDLQTYLEKIIPANENLSDYDKIIAENLMKVFFSDHEDITADSILMHEREQFNTLIQNQASKERMKHMIHTGKPLKN